MSGQESVAVDNLNFSYGGPAILKDLNLHLPMGSRCLLVGSNGAGKSTLLRILAGKRMAKGSAFVLGHHVYEDTPQVIAHRLINLSSLSV
jgi:CCR4-NOT complex subunit CAF16